MVCPTVCPTRPSACSQGTYQLPVYVILIIADSVYDFHCHAAHAAGAPTVEQYLNEVLIMRCCSLNGEAQNGTHAPSHRIVPKTRNCVLSTCGALHYS